MIKSKASTRCFNHWTARPMVSKPLLQFMCWCFLLRTKWQIKYFLSHLRKQRERLWTSSMQSVYPKALIPEPEDIMITKWKSDSLFSGTSTAHSVGITDRDHEDLSAAIGRLYISGSAIHKSYAVYLHGAYFYAGKQLGDEVAETVHRIHYWCVTATHDLLSG